MEYAEFLQSKSLVAPTSGIVVEYLGAELFDFQRDIAKWALRKGRAGIFAGTGMGKTVMQLEWARHAADRVLILAPLAVANQTVAEGAKFGIEVTYAQSGKDSPAHGLTVTNYERMEAFDASNYGAVVLDESSILKSFTGKTRTALINKFQCVPMRLCCTATPAPNDIAEIANHAEFLGVMTRVEMLAAFFVHDDEGWRLKKHATDPFYKWLASWAMTIQKPSDLGYPDDGFILPPLRVNPEFVEAQFVPQGDSLFPMIKGIKGRLTVRHGSKEARIAQAVKLIESEPNKQWIVWCGLNDESQEITEALLGNGVAEVKGADSQEWKVEALTGFAEGKFRILVTKPRIAGFGMNFQNCCRVVFVGLGDSWEQYYQAIRRCWRFGQLQAVNVHIILSEHESVVYNNVMRKESEAETMSKELIKHVAEFEKAEVTGGMQKFDYSTGKSSGDGWELYRGDSAEALKDLPDASVGLAIYSPPFAKLYTYSNTERDLGNSRTDTEFFEHYRFITKELLRVVQPGRNVCVHVAQIPTMKQTEGVIGLHDFRGDIIRQMVDVGFVFHGEVTIDKDPQAQAIRTHSKALLFVQLRKDSSWLRPALADYILIFRTPGENEKAIQPDLTNNEWIEWARPVWYNISETDTLNVAEGRDNRDERHICPLQLGTIERCIRLWSNKGETVLSPFAGIGSEGYQAILQGRKFIGIELKESYYQCAIKNLKDAERKSTAGTLFASVQSE